MEKGGSSKAARWKPFSRATASIHAAPAAEQAGAHACCRCCRSAGLLDAKDVCVISDEVCRASRRFRRGSFKAVDDVTLTVRQGETLGIVGESGSGKSTLGMALLGLQRISHGTVQFQGRRSAITAGAKKPCCARICKWCFRIRSARFRHGRPSNGSSAKGSRCIAGTRRGRAPREGDRGAARGRAGSRGLDRYPHEFSGGSGSVSRSRAPVLEPSILILDEPTSALDVSIQPQVLTLLADIQRKHNLGYVFISHDLEVIGAMAHRVAVMRDGFVVESGEVENIFADPSHYYTRKLLRAAMES